MQSSERRKFLRRSIRYPAYVDLGPDVPLRACMLCNVSQGGAELSVSDLDSLPEHFTLALSIDGGAQRRCRVVWKADSQIGVEFLKTPKRNSRQANPHPAHRDRPVDGPMAASGQIDVESISQG